VIKDCREITVNAVSFPQQRGTVLYACSPCGADPVAVNRASRTTDKIHLLSILREHYARTESSPRAGRRLSSRADLPIQVVHDPLGRPQLLGECDGPAISFSEGGGRIWAALCGDEYDIGIDVAVANEFQRGYPFHRVFHPQELQHALRLAGGDLERASALLWSIKEATVKALGCAFHLVAPLQITVYPSAQGVAWGNDGYTFPVGFPIAAGRSLWVRSLPQRKMWLSIALLNRQYR
jgi:4'-phosphopantetheinyl transferase superfamily